MDRSRFEFLLDAYGADFARWPAREREAGAAFALAHERELSLLLADARAFDDLLGTAKAPPSVDATLSARILAAAPRKAATRRPSFAMAGLALAACALVGVFVGYGAGTFVPQSADDSYLTAAFEAPFDVEAGDEG